MVTAKRVHWTASARDQLYALYKRISQKSPERAQEVMQAIIARTRSLEQDYPGGGFVGLLKNEKITYKYITIFFYKIIYAVVEDKVIIKTIYHERQDPQVG
ncbi:MAG: type II toxin-antitoxin system RelE/ParE family toxin [Bacteroidota bacterium]